MKTFSKLLVVFAMFAFTNVQAEELPKAEKQMELDYSTEYETVRVAAKVPLGLKQAVVDELIYPEYAKRRDLEGQVYMRLCVCDENTVKIVGLSATNPYLGKYVKKELADLYVKEPGCQPGQVFMLKVNFDLLNN